ncbi:hypothetical protein LTR67_001392 [Exophiala xenobiotica]
MLCDNCRQLIQQSELLAPDEQATYEVTTTDFEAAIKAKCYLCTRLRIQLGDEKWTHILSDLPKDNLITFDKSLTAALNFSLVRLGCKLTPIIGHDSSGLPVEGKGYSYGYLQVTVAPQTSRVLDLIRHWLGSCVWSTSHPKCLQQVQQPMSYPSRLIDVGASRGTDDFWRLVIVAGEELSAPYITLSHRWGQDMIKLEQGTQEAMLRGMPVSVLPGTYQDAIRVVRHIGVRYLWIDSLCIRQDELKDIHQEAVGMAEVFGNALCNISALSGRQDGLFSTREPEVVSGDSVRLNAEDYGLSKSFLINDLQLWRGELIHMPLTTRGWVLQEEILAPRTVYFGARQVLWECSGFRACETYPTMQPKRPVEIPPDVDKDRYFLHDEEIGPISSVLEASRRAEGNQSRELRPFQSMLFTVWTSFVGHYSLRHLSFPADKILAVAGVSKLFGVVMKDRFLAGLWRKHFLDSLLWYIRPNTKTVPPFEYRAPSWSWASKDGYVVHAEPAGNPWIVARALEVSCATSDGSEFGTVISAILHLQAPSLDLAVDESGAWTISNVPGVVVRLDSTEDLGSTRHALAVIIRTNGYRLVNADPGSARKVILAAQGIVLAPCIDPASGAGSGTYRRIGYFALEDRRRSTLTPNWLPCGCRIFPEPIGPDAERQLSAETFRFDEQGEFLGSFDII